MTAFNGWETLVITELNRAGAKVPFTKANFDFLDRWQAAEGNGGANNPFNTTLGGYPSAGTVPGTPGVQNYSSPAAGAAATAATIRGYSTIVSALESGNPFQSHFAQGLATDFHTWSRGPNAPPGLTDSYQSIVDAAQGGASSGGGGGGSLTDKILGASVDSLTGGAVTDVVSHIPIVGGLVSSIDSTGTFLQKITEPSFWLRVLQIAGGAGMAAIGVVLLVRQVALAGDSGSPSAIPIPSAIPVPVPV